MHLAGRKEDLRETGLFSFSTFTEGQFLASFCTAEHLQIRSSGWVQEDLPRIMELSTLPGVEIYSNYNSTWQDFGLSSFTTSNATSQLSMKNTTTIIIAIAITALYSVVCVVGLLGNILVMYGIVR